MSIELPTKCTTSPDALKTAKPPRSLSRLAIHGVRQRSNKPDEARLHVQRMSLHTDKCDGTIRHRQATFLIKKLPTLPRALVGLVHKGRVVRMNPLENKFHG